MPPSVSQLNGVAAQLVHGVTSQNVAEDAAAALRACFPQGAYLSITTGNTTPAGKLQLIEQSNFFQAGDITKEPVPISGGATADAIAGNQNFYFDESVHKDKANTCRDFVRLSNSHDCAAVVAVPLPCHSKVGGDPRAACPHCGKSFMLAGRPLGCLLLGIRRNTNYSIREYLAKLVVLAGCLGPRLLALRAAPSRGQGSPPIAQHVSAPPPPRPPAPPQVHVAMTSSWYGGAPPPASLAPRRNSIDVGSLAGATSWNPLTSPRTPTSLASAMLPPLPEGPPMMPDLSFAQQRTSLDWLMASSIPPDNRMSLDSQVSAHSMALLGSRSGSVDGRTAALLQQVNNCPLNAMSLPSMSDPGPMLPPSTAAMAQQLGLLDLVNASPEKAQLIEALRTLQLSSNYGGYGA